ncbi:hypothetical protein ACVILJ_002662 [Bradyrhizobium diazoefficiens]|nr:hypothetical protein BD122_13751 [Bradyrhizobium diazoefficiens]
MTRLREGKLEDVYGRLRKMSFLVLAACFAICSIVSAHADDDDRGRGGESRAYAIGLWGDLPYSDLQAQVGVPNLIADMNDQKLAFTVHDGDLKAGSGTPGSVTPTTCSDALYQQGLGYFNALKSAAMVTPATMTGPTATGRRTARSTRATGSTTSGRFSSALTIPLASGRSSSRCSMTSCASITTTS